RFTGEEGVLIIGRRRRRPACRATARSAVEMLPEERDHPLPWQSSHLPRRSRVINSLRGYGNPVGMQSSMARVAVDEMMDYDSSP
ncbi:MAG: hypothetical protein ACRDRT_05720, partial [Pseudonocardiaceae bacterium]